MYTVLVAENEPWVLRGIVKMVEEAGEEFQVVRVRFTVKYRSDI
jgi:two-component system response regulator YesN